MGRRVNGIQEDSSQHNTIETKPNFHVQLSPLEECSAPSILGVHAPAHLRLGESPTILQTPTTSFLARFVLLPQTPQICWRPCRPAVFRPPMAPELSQPSIDRADSSCFVHVLSLQDDRVTRGLYSCVCGRCLCEYLQLCGVINAFVKGVIVLPIP